MELTALEVLNAYTVLRSILTSRRALPHQASYRLARLSLVLEPEALLIEQQRALIVKGIVGEQPNTEAGGWQVPDDKMPEYHRQWGELAATKIALPHLLPVSVSELGNGDAISPEEIVVLLPILKEA